ncbi:leucine-rich_repeat domain-containing protein [Hexamita inflata]|uniref:Leucine-rich repeat domain-containing protein n=1 Tax=Hexamita inflata TaxID=28002 RepID=A0AA86QV33_9EUKA|nr:leucine-rich repeat domain-containing protein [Hexamita inflata]
MSEQKCYLVNKLEDLRSKEIEKYVNVSIVNIYFKKLDHIPVHIQVLKINSCSLQSLKNLCNLVYLKHLDIRDNLINDISEIIIHQELTYLDIANNYVILIDPIAALKKLISLHTNNNMILNFEPVINHANFLPSWISPQQLLQPEDVANTLTPGSTNQNVNNLINVENEKKENSEYRFKMITLVSPLVQNNKLNIKNESKINNILFSDYLRIDTLSLNNCPNVCFDQVPVKIKHLSIVCCGLIKIDGVEKMSQLESIDLSGNNLVKCEILKDMKQLKAINLTNNKIIDLKHIREFIQYQNVFVSKQAKPRIADYKQYLGQEATEAQVQEMVAEMEENAVSNEEIIYDTEMQHKYKDKVKNGVLEINRDQSLKSTEFTDLIGNNKVTELRVTSCYNIMLDRCPKSSVTSLTINKCNLKDLNGIQVMTQLTQLNLSLNQISDISLLAPLTNLTALDLGQNNIECASVLSNLKQLISLDLSENLITDISSLRDLVKLQILDVSYNNLNSLNDLSSLSNITQLNITQTNTCNIDSLAKMTKLTHLLMSSNKIISIQILDKFTELYDLRLENNFIQDFEPIAKHKFANKNWVRQQKVPTENDFMNAFNCNQYEVSKLVNKNKEKKEISDNKFMLIKKYENQVVNKSLKINGEMELNNLQFTDVLKLTELEAINSKTINFAESQVPILLLKLKLNNCTFKNYNMNLNPITGIYQMEQLVELDLSFNKIREVSEIGNLTNLKKLFLQNNDIHRINELRNLAKLTHVNISNNKVIFSEPLNQLKIELLIDNNMVTDNVALKNQQKPQLVNYKNFMGPNCTDEQVNELAHISSDMFYNLQMKQKYNQSVQNQSLSINSDNNLGDIGFTQGLNVKAVNVKDCTNLKLPRAIVKRLTVKDGILENYIDVRPIQIPSQIVQFSAVNCKLTSLVGLELLNNIKIIQIVDNPVTSLEPILGLRQVTSLTVSNSKLNNITGIKQMKQLVELNLGSNQIREISELGNLTNLSKLNLTSNKISDVSEIGKLTNLQKLELQNNNIHKINELRNLGKLTHVNLSNNKVIFSEPLNQLKIELLIDNNMVTDNVALKNQQKPQLINYKNFMGPNSTENQINELSTIVPLDFNYNLQMVQKYSDAVKNSELKIENDTVLTDFGFTSEIKATALTVLNCENVKLPVLQNVKYFKTSGGALVDYSEVKLNKVPSQITALTVNNCELNHLTSIKQMKQLQYVDLRDNCIISCEPLKHLINLQMLFIDNNCIQDLEFITTLPNYKLDWIYYQRTPTASDIQNYQQLSNIGVEFTKHFELKLQKTRELIRTGPEQYDEKMVLKYQNKVSGNRLAIQSDNELKDFKFVEKFNITTLCIERCYNVRFWRTPNNVTVLENVQRCLKSVRGIEKMKQLQTLAFTSNNVVDISCLKELPNLTSLDVGWNKIVDFSPVQHLINRRQVHNWNWSQSKPTQQEIEDSKRLW